MTVFPQTNRPRPLVTERAWAAGFYDGEGCTSVQRWRTGTGERLGLLLTVSQVDARPLLRFAAAVGHDGGLALRPARAGRSQPIWRWAAHGERAERVLALLWPWLSAPKQEQAARVVDAVHANWLQRGSPRARSHSGRPTPAAALTRALLLPVYESA